VTHLIGEEYFVSFAIVDALWRVRIDQRRVFFIVQHLRLNRDPICGFERTWMFFFASINVGFELVARDLHRDPLLHFKLGRAALTLSRILGGFVMIARFGHGQPPTVFSHAMTPEKSHKQPVTHRHIRCYATRHRGADGVTWGLGY